MKYWIIQGEVEDVCSRLPENHFDAVLCDPPYGLKFMGKKWDYTLPSVGCWESILRVLKPGAYAMSFGGSRTFHRADCNVEDAGFEIRDHIAWMYAKGMPKPATTMGKLIDAHLGNERLVVGHKVLTGNAGISTAEKGGTYGIGVGSTTKTIAITGAGSELSAPWEGHGMALAPAWEPVTVARKPLDGIYAINALKWGTGAMWVDGCRIERVGAPVGNWPRNVILDEGAGQVLDEIVGNRPSHPSVTANGGGGKRGFRDNGGAARFYFSAKVSSKERNAGCESLVLKSAGDCVDREDGAVDIGNGAAGAGRTGGHRNHHPCVKPIALCEYLAKLILPPPRSDGSPRRLLVPFSGSGSEMIGALLAGWDEVVGIELDPEDEGYNRIACLRIEHWTKVTDDDS